MENRLKGIEIIHHLLTLKLFQTCTNYFLLLNTNILKNVGIKQLMGPIDSHSILFPPYYGSQLEGE